MVGDEEKGGRKGEKIRKKVKVKAQESYLLPVFTYYSGIL